ncbi:MAG: LPS export ABC transporter periplasmic protein LptC [Treponema sp.]|nr:LPS export ABC transporter periplasmic protein LptC [Treponema sp.]MBP3607508.1 LPS export ABC transporter periplasmic protein LptC [Treponema sp.]
MLTNLLKSLIILLFAYNFFSCSLNYGTEKTSEETVPEFSFLNSNYNKYEENKLSIEMKAKKMEQYKTNGDTYAESVVFKTYNDDGTVDTEGSCNLLSSNTKTKKYSLFDNIEINIYDQEMILFATSLYFNGTTEQLTSSQTENVLIKKKDTEIEGIGFSASGVSKKYAYASNIKGKIISEETDENKTPQTMDVN